MKTPILFAAAICGLLLNACSSERGAHDDDHATEHEHETAAPAKDDDHTMALTPAMREAADLRFATAGPAVLEQRLRLYGSIAPNAERTRSIAARYPGRVQSVSVSVGDTVRQGQALASIESDESLQVYSIVSPLNGVVTERLTNPGEQAESRALFTVTDLSSVWVELALYPRDLPTVTTGQAVTIQTVDGGAVGTGEIVFISPIGTATTQSLQARVLLDNRSGRWAPGLYVQGDVMTGRNEVDLAVPNVALQTLDDGPAVFVETADGIVPREVQIGRDDGQWTEILAGLQAGERIVTDGSFVLKAELSKGEAEHAH